MDGAAWVEALNGPAATFYVPTIGGAIVGLVVDRRRGAMSARFGLWAYVILPLALLVLQPLALAATEAAAPRNIDHLLAQWDAVLFGAPSFAWGRMVYGHAWRMVAVSLWYASLPAAIPLGIAAARRPVVAVVAYVVIAASGPTLYWLLAALGPAQAVEMFPWRVDWAAIPHGTCNSFPSLHTASAIVALCCAPRRLVLPWVVYVAGIVFTCVATGQHWLVDCVAGAVLGTVTVAVLSMWPVKRLRGGISAEGALSGAGA